MFITKGIRSILFPNIKCELCGERKEYVYIWFGKRACNPCIVERVMK